MEYPNPIMSITELEEMGFTRSYLKEMAHRRGQKYATYSVGRGKFFFDTRRFEKEREKMLVR